MGIEPCMEFVSTPWGVGTNSIRDLLLSAQRNISRCPFLLLINLPASHSWHLVRETQRFHE
jgi:hypothetical protein